MMNQDYQNLPIEIADVFAGLERHILSLQAKWTIFKQLFATSKERVELLNRFAPIFFRFSQETLFDDTVLAINRLCDPIKSVNKANLSLDTLVHRIDRKKYRDLQQRADKQLHTLKAQCKRLRDIRNRKLAHNDLDTELNLAPNPLLIITEKEIQDVERALQTIRDLMNTIWMQFYAGSDIGYENVILPNDGEAIISALEKAQKYREMRHLRLGEK
jgi:hypothetical protein